MLVDSFSLDEIYVLKLENGQTNCRRLDADEYQLWLEDNFTPGDLWRQNAFGEHP